MIRASLAIVWSCFTNDLIFYKKYPPVYYRNIKSLEKYIQSVLYLNIYAIDAKILPESAHCGILNAAKLDHTR